MTTNPNPNELSLTNLSKIDSMPLADMVKAGRASGIIPMTVTSDAAACGIILRARELGIPPMSAFTTIFPIEQWNPKTNRKEIVSWGMKAEAMLACVRSRIGKSNLKYELDGGDDQCTGRMSTDGGDTWNSITWTFAMAQKAGLVVMKSGKKHRGWEAHPAAMLRARVISALVRLCAPEAILGMRTPDEEEEIRDLGQPPASDATPAQLVAAKLGVGPIPEPPKEQTKPEQEPSPEPKALPAPQFEQDPEPQAESDSKHEPETNVTDIFAESPIALMLRKLGINSSQLSQFIKQKTDRDLADYESMGQTAQRRLNKLLAEVELGEKAFIKDKDGFEFVEVKPPEQQEIPF